ncbi:MAG: hypothetical protein WBL48_17390, partial [Pseudolabrys sp.]
GLIDKDDYPFAMRRPSGFVEPCLPSKVVRPPSGSLWLHEIKFDGYRLMVRCAAPPTPGSRGGAVRLRPTRT